MRRKGEAHETTLPTLNGSRVKGGKLRGGFGLVPA